MSEPEPKETLYGSEPNPEAPKAPGLLDQVTGVFSEPAALFRRLRDTPVWGGAFVLLLVLNTVFMGIWAKRVDVDAFLRPMLERNPKMTGEMIDQAVATYGKMIVPLSVLQVVFGLAIACLLSALILWGLSKVFAEDASPRTFRQAWSGVMVAGLVGAPKALLLIIISAMRNLGGARPDQLSPTSLGFYLSPERIKLQAFFCSLDLFSIAALVMAYLVMRHTLRAKPVGAWIAVAINAIFLFALPVLGAK
jgi:hypothetical protein